jgi:hypothetical protein
MTTGRLTDMLAFRVRGWDVVAANVGEALLRSLSPRATRVTKIDEDRYTIELPLDEAPDRILAELTAAGAVLISLNPIRDTLEDLFVQHVRASDAIVLDRGLGGKVGASGARGRR